MKQTTWKLIGRPIRLADVLLAVEKQKRKGLVSPQLMRTSEMWEIKRTIDFWNLRDDNLDHQPEATVAFLAELLQ